MTKEKHSLTHIHLMYCWFQTRPDIGVAVSIWWWMQGDGDVEWWWWWMEKVIILPCQKSKHTNTHTYIHIHTNVITHSLLFTAKMWEQEGSTFWELDSPELMCALRVRKRGRGQGINGHMREERVSEVWYGQIKTFLKCIILANYKECPSSFAGYRE